MDSATESPVRPKVLLLILVLVFICSGAAFAPGVGGDFLDWDDGINISYNPRVVPLSLENVAWMFSDGSYALRYKPLSWLAWATVIALFGETIVVMKGMNLLLHSANATLLFLLLLRLSNFLWPSRGNEDQVKLLFGALVATAFWALHPLRAEPVAWVSGLGYPLATFFFLVSVLIFWGRNGPAEEPMTARSGVAIIFFLLSVLAYPVTIFGAFAFPVLQGLVESRTAFPPRRRWMNVLKTGSLFLIPAFLASVLAIVIRYAPSEWDAAPGLNDFILFERLAQGAHGFCIHARHTFFPVDLHPFYDEIRFLAPGRDFLVAALLLVLLTLLFRRRLVLLFTCVATAFLFAIPILGLTEFNHIPSDRYTYFCSLALTPLVFGLAYGGAHCARSRGRQGTLFALGALAVVAMSGTVTLTVQQWKDNDTFYWNAMNGATVERNRTFLATRWIRNTLETEGWEAARVKLDLLSRKPEYRSVHGRINVELERRLAQTMAAGRAAKLSSPQPPDRDGRDLTNQSSQVPQWNEHALHWR